MGEMTEMFDDLRDRQAAYRAKCALARAEKAEQERDGLAATINAVRAWHCGTVAEAEAAMGPEYQALIDGSDEATAPIWKKLFASGDAHLARIRAEAGKAALVEVYDRVKDLRGCNAYDVIDRIQEMAEEADHD